MNPHGEVRISPGLIPRNGRESFIHELWPLPGACALRVIYEAICTVSHWLAIMPLFANHCRTQRQSDLPPASALPVTMSRRYSLSAARLAFGKESRAQPWRKRTPHLQLSNSECTWGLAIKGQTLEKTVGEATGCKEK